VESVMGNCASTRNRRERNGNGSGDGGEGGTNLPSYPQPATSPRASSPARSLPESLHAQTQAPPENTSGEIEDSQAEHERRTQQIQQAESSIENPQQVTSGFYDTEPESEIENQDNTSKYKNVAMGKAEIASAGEGLSTWGLSDCSAVAVLSNFDSESERYEEMGMFHVAGSHVESLGNTSGAMSVIQKLAKGDYTVVIVYGDNSSSETGKSIFTEQKEIKQLLSDAKKQEHYSGSSVSIDRSGKVEVK
jgi:hypothetical protein